MPFPIHRENSIQSELSVIERQLRVNKGIRFPIPQFLRSTGIGKGQRHRPLGRGRGRQLVSFQNVRMWL